MKIYNIDAIILAGGLGRRFREKGGGDKLFTIVEGKPILLRVVESLENVFSRIIVTTKGDKLEDIKKLLVGKEKVDIVVDKIEERTPLAGMLAGATEARSELVFVVSGDAAFIEPSLPEALLELGKNNDSILPIWPSGKVEPLISFYSRRVILNQSTIFSLKPIRATDPARGSQRTALVPVSLLAESGISLRQFANINEPSDLINKREEKIHVASEEVTYLIREKNPYWEAIDSLKKKNFQNAALKFAEEASILSKKRANSLSIHALLDSLFFLQGFAQHHSINPGT